MAPPEKRVDPDDGVAYTWEELLAFYTGKFKKSAIESYWESTCRPQPKAKAKVKAKAKAKANVKDKSIAEAPRGGGGTWTLLYHGGEFKGRGEFVRLILEDAGVTYSESADNLYGPEGFCDAFRASGSSEKGLSEGAADNVALDNAPFPTMFPPVLHYKPGPGEAATSEVFINQVPAILRYCAARLGYLPRGAAATAKADQITLNANDFVAEGRSCFHPLDNKKSYADQKEAADEASRKFADARLPVWLGHFEKVAKRLRPDSDGPLLGTATYADFALFHALDAAEAQFDGERFGEAWTKAEIPTLKKWKTWMSCRPKLADYLGSDRRKPWAGDSMM